MHLEKIMAMSRQVVISAILLLEMLFSASIGFSISMTRRFRGGIVWLGIIYTILMASGKLVWFSLEPAKNTF